MRMRMTTGSCVGMSNATIHLRLPWYVFYKCRENVPMHVVDVLRGM